MTEGWSRRELLADDRENLDVLGSPESTFQFRVLWSRLSPRRKSVVKVCTAVALTLVLVILGRDWLRHRALADKVSLSITLDVSASSATPTGGRVDFYLTVRNDGTLPVSVSSVHGVWPRLRITGDVTGRGFPLTAIEAGQVVRLPLSVVLDCRAGDTPPGVDPLLRATVGAVPESGRRRSVLVGVAQAALMTDIADTVCAINPDLYGDQLDGPVALPAG